MKDVKYLSLCWLLSQTAIHLSSLYFLYFLEERLISIWSLLEALWRKKMMLSGARITAESLEEDGNVFNIGWWVSGTKMCDGVYMSPDQRSTLIKKITKRRVMRGERESDASGRRGGTLQIQESRSIRSQIQNRKIEHPRLHTQTNVYKLHWKHTKHHIQSFWLNSTSPERHYYIINKITCV